MGGITKIGTGKSESESEILITGFGKKTHQILWQKDMSICVLPIFFCNENRDGLLRR